MGLIEKRKIKEFQDVIVPERTKELQGICTAPVIYEIDWDSFSDDLQALHFLDNVSFHRINMAFRALCIDQLAKDACKETLKKIKLKNVKEKKDTLLTFTGGVLEMHLAYALGGDGLIQDTEISKVVAKGL